MRDSRGTGSHGWREGSKEGSKDIGLNTLTFSGIHILLLGLFGTVLCGQFDGDGAVNMNFLVHEKREMGGKRRCCGGRWMCGMR
jgi:hypothetical protein